MTDVNPSEARARLDALSKRIEDRRAEFRASGRLSLVDHPSVQTLRDKSARLEALIVPAQTRPGVWDSIRDEFARDLKTAEAEIERLDAEFMKP